MAKGHPQLRFVGDGDGMWPDLAYREVIQTEDAQIAALANGTSGGNPSLSLRIDLPGTNQTVFAQTTLALWLEMGDRLKALYGDPRAGSKFGR